MESTKDRNVIVQNVVTCIEQEIFNSFIGDQGVEGIKGIEYVQDESGEFSGTCKLSFENAAQAEQCVKKLKGLNFVGVLLNAVQESKLPKGDPKSNIKVNNIDYRINQKQFAEMFQPFGSIVSSRLMMDAKTQQSKGYGFVQFQSPESALAAISALNGK